MYPEVKNPEEQEAPPTLPCIKLQLVEISVSPESRVSWDVPQKPHVNEQKIVQMADTEG